MATVWPILSFSAIMLGVVLGLYAVAMWMRRRLGVAEGTLPPSALPIVGRRNLDRHRSIFVVQVADRYVLLGGAENSVNLVDHITADEYQAMLATDAETRGRGTDDGTSAAAATPAARLQDAFGSFLHRARNFQDLRANASKDDEGVVDLDVTMDEERTSA